MPIRLRNSSNNYVQLEAPSSIASDVTLTLPNTDGDASQFLQTNGSGALTWATPTDTGTGWTWDTTGDTLSGESSVSITGIPSTAKQIIATVRDLSCANDINWGMRAGTSSGVVSSGYESHGWYVNVSSSNSTGTSTTDWSNFGGAAAAFVFNGRAVLTNLTGNVWFCEGQFNIQTTYNTVHLWQGHVELSGTLDRVEFHPGSGTFDSGTVFVHYFEP